MTSLPTGWTGGQRSGVRIGVVTFPGSCDDRDARAAVASMGADPVALWHGDGDLRGWTPWSSRALLYGDYLRCGAIARFSPVMGAVAACPAPAGRLGICNGFQVLCEAGLLLGPAAQRRPARLPRGRGGGRLHHHLDGRLHPRRHPGHPGQARRGPLRLHDPAALAAAGQVVFRYAPAHNPNGSLADIAGVRNPPATSSASCPTPSTPSTRSWARWAACCSSRSWPPVSSGRGRTAALGLTDEELERILGVLGREPTRPSWPCSR